jgi:hypothetical protein
MKMKIFGLVACIALFGVSSANAVTYTYNVDITSGANGVTGFIQTDCNNCTLQNADITSYDLSLFIGSSSVEIIYPSGGNSANVAGSDFVADPHSLVFNFSATDAASIFLGIPASNICFEGGFGCSESNEVAGFAIVVNSVLSVTPEGVGPFLIGSLVATPLPAALPLFASGLGALGLLGWRRKRKAAALAA